MFSVNIISVQKTYSILKRHILIINNYIQEAGVCRVTLIIGIFLIIWMFILSPLYKKHPYKKLESCNSIDSFRPVSNTATLTCAYKYQCTYLQEGLERQHPHYFLWIYAFKYLSHNLITVVYWRSKASTCLQPSQAVNHKSCMISACLLRESKTLCKIR